MNAIYFKATWTDKFDANDTKDEAFTTEDGVQKTLPMMHRKARAICGENDIYTILNLPYGSEMVYEGAASKGGQDHR